MNIEEQIALRKIELRDKRLLSALLDMEEFLTYRASKLYEVHAINNSSCRCLFVSNDTGAKKLSEKFVLHELPDYLRDNGFYVSSITLVEPPDTVCNFIVHF